jgi:hypothetical protein
MDLGFWFYGSRFWFRTNFLFAVKNDQNYDESGNPWYSTWLLNFQIHSEKNGLKWSCNITKKDIFGKSGFYWNLLENKNAIKNQRNGIKVSPRWSIFSGFLAIRYMFGL